MTLEGQGCDIRPGFRVAAGSFGKQDKELVLEAIVSLASFKTCLSRLYTPNPSVSKWFSDQISRRCVWLPKFGVEAAPCSAHTHTHTHKL